MLSAQLVNSLFSILLLSPVRWMHRLPVFSISLARTHAHVKEHTEVRVAYVVKYGVAVASYFQCRQSMLSESER